MLCLRTFLLTMIYIFIFNIFCVLSNILSHTCPLMDFKVALLLRQSGYCDLIKAAGQISCATLPWLKVRRIMRLFVPDVQTWLVFHGKLAPISSVSIFCSICVLILSETELHAVICSPASLAHLNSWLIFSDHGLFPCSLGEGCTGNSALTSCPPSAPSFFSDWVRTYCQTLCVL